MEETPSYDKDVDDLFEDLGEADAAPEPESLVIPGLIETLHEQEGRLDPWRVLLVRYVREVGRFLRSAQGARGNGEDRSVHDLAGVIKRLLVLPDNGGRVLVRHRGRGRRGRDRTSMESDYAVWFGAVRLDPVLVEETARRLGPAASTLPGEYAEACLELASLGINSVYLSLAPEASADPGDPFLLRPFFRAFRAYGESAPLAGVARDDADGPPVILDEKRKPSVNLSALAAVNNLKRGTVQVLINQVDAMMRRAGARDPLRHYTGVFDGIFAFRRLWGTLKRPRLEINNPRWLVASGDGDVVPEEDAALVRLVSREFGDWSPKSARMLDALTAEDYGRAESWQVVERLGYATELIEAMEIAVGSPDDPLTLAGSLGPASLDRVMETIRQNLDKVPDDSLDLMVVTGDQLAAPPQNGEASRRYVDRRLIAMAEFFKNRSRANQKMKSLLRHAAEFETTDYETVALDFGIELDDAVELVGLLGQCFDTKGHFVRATFEKNIPAFCRHEKRVFEFLWHYLKEHMAMEDRIALLNALKVLINRMHDPTRALYVLMEGFFRDPETISFADRNAMILANVLLRKFNKELQKDIKMTPEEVLHVRDGLDQEAARFTAALLDKEKDRFFAKIRTVHKELKRAINPYTWHDAMPLGYLLTLEREVYILLALCGGNAASSVLRSALWEYGNPDSDIYRMAERKDQFVWLFHILQVVVRGVGRVGETIDAALLADIRARNEDFMILAMKTGTRDQVRRFMEWVDRASNGLESKEKNT